MASVTPSQRPDPGTASQARLETLRHHLLACGHARMYKAGTVIVEEGEPADSLYWIVSGELAAYVQDAEGRVLELRRMLPDEFFGELLFASTARTASVRAVTDARLCRVARNDLEALIAAQPGLAMAFIETLSARLVALTGTVRDIALSDVYSRLARFLEECAVEVDGGRRLEGFSQQAVAERLGASKSMVNRLLKDLEAGGYLQIERRGLLLHRKLPKAW